MKKLLIALLLGLSISVMAETYSPTLAELLDTYKSSKITVYIVTNSNIHPEYKGVIILVQKDYIVLREEDSVVILNLTNIVEVTHD